MDAVLTVNDGSDNSTNGCCNADAGLTMVTESVADATAGDAQLDSVVTEKSSVRSIVDKNSHGHRAGFDAYMTGCVFAWAVVAYGQSSTVSDAPACSVTNSEFVNRVYLGGKDFPLQVTHSSFAKPSKCHLDKWRQINSASSSQ